MRHCAYCHRRLAARKRADARYCSDQCRRRSYLGLPLGTAANGFRRPSRDGAGVKVYLLPDELSELAAATDHPKLRAAQRRLIARSAA